MRLALAAIVMALLAQSGKPPEPQRPATQTPLKVLVDSLPDPESIGGLRGTDAERWLQVNQDAPSYKSGVIDTQEILRQIDSQGPQNLPEWVMLDFEDPFFKDLAAADGTPERTRAVSSMLATLRAAKARWPGVKFGFYGLPNLPFWVEGKGWADLDADQKRAALAKAERDAAPVLAEADWVSPSVYAYYDPAMVRPGNPDSIRGTPKELRENDRAWRSMQVGLAVLMARGKPVLPTVCPFWAPGGVAPWCRWIDRRAFIESQIEPVARMRAQGVMIWTGMKYRIGKVTDPALESGATEKNFGVAEWRAAFERDMLDSQKPADWTDPEVRRRLERATTRAIVQTIVDIRAWERAGALPAADAPVVPPPG